MSDQNTQDASMRPRLEAGECRYRSGVGFCESCRFNEAPAGGRGMLSAWEILEDALFWLQ